jgi:hypothetical protein
MKKTLSLLLIACLLAWIPSLSTAGQEEAALQAVRKAVSGEFSRLDAALTEAARKIGKTGLTGEGARSALAALCDEFTFAVDCTAVDPRGRMVTVEPPAYREVEGTEIGDQAQVRQVIRTKKPVLSSVFRAVEGFDAADIEYPVLDRKGRYIGSVSLLFKTEVFFAQLLERLVQDCPLDICVMEKKGRVIYDPDLGQIGHNLFTSPLYRSYPELLKLGKRIATLQEGRGSYRYRVRGEERTARKSAAWTTATLYGTPWRIVGIRVEPD